VIIKGRRKDATVRGGGPFLACLGVAGLVPPKGCTHGLGVKKARLGKFGGEGKKAA